MLFGLSEMLFTSGFILYLSGGFDEGIMFAGSILCITVLLFLIAIIIQLIANISYVYEMICIIPAKW